MKRLACQCSFDACAVVEHRLLSSLSKEAIRADRAAERDRRRMRVEQMRIAVQLEQAKVDAIKTRVAQAKPFIDEQHKLVQQAKSALERRVADFNLSADEVKRFQQAAAATPPASAAAASPAAAATPPSPADPLRKILLEFQQPLSSPFGSGPPEIAMALRGILAFHRCRPFKVEGAEDAAIAQLNHDLHALYHATDPAPVIASAVITALASSPELDWVKPVALLDQRSFVALAPVINKARAILEQALPNWQTKGRIATKHVTSAPVSAEEYRELQHELATALRAPAPSVAAPAPASSSRPSTVAATAASPSSRLWQLTPAFTSNMRSYLLSIESKLAKVRLGLMSRMLDLYVIRRKSPYSCSIVGLEIYDDPQELFNHSEPPPPPIEHPNPGSPAHLQMIQQQQALLAKQAQQQGSNGMNGEIVAAALGYTLLVLHLLSCYLSIHLPYTLRFHGSHSYVEFNDEDSSRYFLTLLDNSNPNHFRRAITLLNHDIQFLCESVSVSISAGAAWLKQQQQHAHHNAANLAPIHLLPNMLKLIETAERSLKQQYADPHALQEQRLLQAQAIYRTQELERQRMQATLQKHQQDQQAYQLWLQQQRAHAAAPTMYSSPSQQHLALDASISQSMVAVHREDALPPHHASSKPPPTSARSQQQRGGGLSHVDVLPPGFEHPSFGRLDSPPFYSEHQQAQALGADNLAASPLQRTLSGGSNSSSSGSGSASPADASSPIKAAMQPNVNTGNSLSFVPFSAPGMQSYVMTEEPRESMLLLTKEQMQRMASQPRAPAAFNFATPQRAAGTGQGAGAAVTLQSPPPPFHDASGGAHRALSYATPAQQHQHQITASISSTNPSFHTAPPRSSPTNAAAAAVPVLPNAAAQFGFLDASHPLHPSHHLLGTPPGNAGGSAANTGTFPDQSLLRVASSPMQMHGTLQTHQQQQQQQTQQPSTRPPAHPQMQSSQTTPLQQRPFLSSPFSRPAAAIGSPSSSASSPSPAPLSSPSPLPPSFPSSGPSSLDAAVSLPAVSYASEADLEWDLIDVVREDPIDRGEQARRVQGHSGAAGRTSGAQPQR